MRDMIAAMSVFLVLAPRLPIDPPLTLCDEIAERWNKNLNGSIGVMYNGMVCVLEFGEGDGRLMDGAWLIANEAGWREGIWPKPMIDALVAACSRYGILGVS